MAYQSILNPHPVTVGNASLAVTGTFWQATQPVSGTVTVGNASLAVTGTFYQATQPVSIATMPSTPVTGTFWQTTQPVSGTVTVGNASLAVTGTFWQATQPVSISSMPSTPVTGTFWQATQPVSLTSTTITGNVAITATALPLPSGAATETSLAALNAKVTTVGQAASVIDLPEQDALASILVELRVISTLLQIGLGVRDDPADLRNDFNRVLN